MCKRASGRPRHLGVKVLTILQTGIKYLYNTHIVIVNAISLLFHIYNDENVGN